MQLGGIGRDHSSETHQVTNCMHEHTHYKKVGAAASAASNMNAQTFQLQEQQQEAQFSLSAWLQKTLRGGRNLFKGIWGTNDVNSPGPSGDKLGQAQLMAAVDENMVSKGQKAASISADVQGNPYFAVVQGSPSSAHMTPFQKVRAKVKGVTGQLAGKLPRHFFRSQARNSFQAKSEQRSKEDLRKRSKYRKDELEIDCILTDESYLMDSYDRKGEYSQLTTKK